jgi:hypothetical protein
MTSFAEGNLRHSIRTVFVVEIERQLAIMRGYSDHSSDLTIAHAIPSIIVSRSMFRSLNALRSRP